MNNSLEFVKKNRLFCTKNNFLGGVTFFVNSSAASIFLKKIGDKREYTTKSYFPIFQVKVKNIVQGAKGLGMSLYYFCILLNINTFFLWRMNVFSELLLAWFSIFDTLFSCFSVPLITTSSEFF